MVDVNTQNKTISVNVSSSGVSSNVNASGDTTMYYSNKAREWAISNRIVDGVDYSSKYYANKSNQSALNAQSFAQSAQDSYNNVQNSATKALEDIGTDKTNAISEINTTKTSAINNITTAKNSAISDIDTTAKSYDNLTHKQITNCLLEIPQRIKYDLTDGTLTVKAGSVVIVPYGTEDLTAITEDDVYVKIQQSSYNEVRYWYIKKADADILFKTYEFKQGLILYKVNDDNSVGDIDDTVTLYDYYQGIIYKDTLEPIYGGEYSVLIKGNYYKKNGADVKFDYYFHIPNTIYYFGTNNVEFDSDNDLSIYNEVFTFDGENYVRLEGYIGYYNQGWSWLHDPQGNIVFDNGEWSGQRIEVLNTGGFSIGDTFINENFKVADMQYAKDIDGNYKFFVWAELQSDISGQGVSWNGQCVVFINADKTLGFISTSQCASGDTAPTNATQIWYDTKNNSIKETEDFITWTDIKASLPISLVTLQTATPYIKSFDQVFNGTGYMGSTVWVDKGFKGLYPNGRNTDGSLINIEYIQDRLSFYHAPASLTGNYDFVGDELGNIGVGNYSRVSSILTSVYNSSTWLLHEPTNTVYQWDGEAYVIKGPNAISIVPLGSVSVSAGVITSFTANLPFRAADYNEFTSTIDGKWIYKLLQLCNEKSIVPNTTHTYSLADYLPNDNNLYEIIAAGYCNTERTAGTLTFMTIKTDFITNVMAMFEAETRTANQGYDTYHGTLLSGTGRQIIVNSNSASVNSSIYTLKLYAYRKVR